MCQSLNQVVPGMLAEDPAKQACAIAAKANLGCELGAALLLEPGQNAALMLITGAAVLQQAACQLLPVELGKQVLVADVSQQLDHFLKRVLDGLISQLLTSALQPNDNSCSQGNSMMTETRAGMPSLHRRLQCAEHFICTWPTVAHEPGMC